MITIVNPKDPRAALEGYVGDYYVRLGDAHPVEARLVGEGRVEWLDRKLAAGAPVPDPVASDTYLFRAGQSDGPCDVPGCFVCSGAMRK